MHPSQGLYVEVSHVHCNPSCWNFLAKVSRDLFSRPSIKGLVPWRINLFTLWQQTGVDIPFSYTCMLQNVNTHVGSCAQGLNKLQFFPIFLNLARIQIVDPYSRISQLYGIQNMFVPPIQNKSHINSGHFNLVFSEMYYPDSIPNSRTLEQLNQLLNFKYLPVLSNDRMLYSAFPKMLPKLNDIIGSFTDLAYW